MKNCLLCLMHVHFLHNVGKCVKKLDFVNWASLVDRVIVTHGRFTVTSVAIDQV